MSEKEINTILPFPSYSPSDSEEMRRRYEFIINTSRDLMTLINRNYVYEATNDAYCLAHAKTREEIIGKTLADVWGEEVFSGIIKGYIDRCFGGEEVNYQASFAFPKLGIRHFDVTYYPYFDVRELVRHVVVVSRDITERKWAEEELRKAYDELERKVNERTYDLGIANEELEHEIAERTNAEAMLREKNSMLQTLINAIPDLVFFKDTEGRFLLGNKAMEESMGLRQEEFVGKTDYDISPPDVAEACKRSDAEALKAGGSSRAEESYTDKNGKPKFLDVVKSRICDANGDLIGLVGVSRDITERKLMEMALHQSEEKFRTLFESASDALFIINMDGNIIDVNRTAYERLGYTKEEMLSMHLSQLDHSDFAAMLPLRMEYVREHGSGFFESAHKRKDGTMMPVEINVRIIDFEGMKVRFSIIRDITERKQMEEALLENEKRYRTLFEQSPDGILLIGPEGKMIEFNETAHRELGYSHEEFAKLSLSDIDPVESPEEIQARIGKVLEAGQAEFDVKHRTKQGEVRDVHVITKVIVLGDRPYSYAIWQDITERKKSEEKINQSLREKETLLRELYHRTKNNMQVITSLLNLQTKDIADEKTLQILEDTKNRIHSMALVHEKLYKTKNLSQVYLSDYVKDLAGSLMKSHNADNGQISLHVNIERMLVSIDTITPLGLVINELVTNAMKYAFPNNKKGDIIIEARLNENEIVELIFSDNGIGMPKNINLQKTESLGLTIVRTLVVSQMKGKLEMQIQDGTTFIIKFKDKDIQARI